MSIILIISDAKLIGISGIKIWNMWKKKLMSLQQTLRTRMLRNLYRGIK
jgi:hypothetical protein